MDITAKLRNASKIPNGYGGFVLVGQIYGDAKKRFSDGEWITTSKVLHEDENNVIFTTRNSIYQVESWENDKQ